MKIRKNWVFIFCIICLVWLVVGCATLKIVDLNQETSEIQDFDYTIKQDAGIAKMQIGENNAYGDAKSWQEGLSRVLKAEGVFENITYPYHDNDEVDIVVRGNVAGDFRNLGFNNFVTWWPGPLFLSQMWRGTRFIYDAHANIEIVDPRTNEVLDTYRIDTSHELIHRSYNPLHLFGVVLFYGVIKASLTTWPREKYRQLMYEVAYPDLWKKAAFKIATDQRQRYVKDVELLHERCGDRIDQRPVVGLTWSEFIACQTDKFTLLGQENTITGQVSVYANKDRSLQIRVVEGRIISWVEPTNSKSSGIRWK